MNHMIRNTCLGSPCHIGSALGRRLHIEPASEVALESGGLSLVEVLAAALAAARARARVEVSGLQLEAVLDHPQQTPPLARLQRVDIRLQFGGWVLTRAATSNSQQNSSISNHTHQNLLVNSTERIHV